jgi:D-sedoheptulose 7-phosphate isomerase
MNLDAARALATTRVRESAAVIQSLLEAPGYLNAVIASAEAMVKCLRAGNKILFFGNGGSAADAQHLAAELSGRFLRERPGLPGLALTTNTSALTAIGNDYSFENVFARQIEGLGKPQDVAFAISTSGNSPNVLKAVASAHANGMTSIGLVGNGRGKLGGLVQHCICVPSDQTPRIQEAHILTGHILCEMIEEELFGK